MYLDGTRQAGHTTTMLEGAKNTPDAVVIVAKSEQNRFFRDHGLTNECLSIDLLDQLRGRRAPLAFDNYALRELFGAAEREIVRLTKEINSLSKS
jgi:hypothetical protein